MLEKKFHPLRVLISLLIVVLVPACAGRIDAAMVYTEGGIEAAGNEWVRAYHTKADQCERAHEPETPEMEECFGSWYDAHDKVLDAVRYARAALIGYWIARAAGENPDLAKVLQDIHSVFEALPPEARGHFDRVRGLR